MSYESAKNPSVQYVMPANTHRLSAREQLGLAGEPLINNTTIRNPFARQGYNPLLAKMQGYGEPPADDCPVGSAKDPFLGLCLPTGGVGNVNCPPGLVFDQVSKQCVWPQNLPPQPATPPVNQYQQCWDGSYVPTGSPCPPKSGGPPGPQPTPPGPQPTPPKPNPQPSPPPPPPVPASIFSSPLYWVGVAVVLGGGYFLYEEYKKKHAYAANRGRGRSRRSH